MRMRKRTNEGKSNKKEQVIAKRVGKELNNDIHYKKKRSDNDRRKEAWEKLENNIGKR